MSSTIALEPVGILRSPYRQKFAVPRQPNLVREAVGEIVFAPRFSDPNCLRGLEQFSHLWLVFLFHETAAHGWSPTVAPPRLGGSAKLGVFATRSTFRPNPLGLSVVEYAGWELRKGQLVLSVRGIDLIDGTPILDIKPYLPYADALPDARAGYAGEAPATSMAVDFSPAAQLQLEQWADAQPQLEAFIRAVLAQDPRPAVHVRQHREREYGMFLHDLNVRWQVSAGVCLVLAIEKADFAALS